MTISETYNEDCMALMARYPDKHFDLSVVDPPYGIGLVKTPNGNWGIRKENKKSHSKIKDWDFSKPTPAYIAELFRVSKNQIIFGANHFITAISMNSSCWIVWDKHNGDTYYADCELAWTSFPTAVRKIDIKWSGMNTHREGRRIHECQKPIALYDWIFKNYAKPGQLILDTHLGSGSSRIAADKAGLNFVGCELDADYFAAQEKRWREYKMQLKLL